LKPRIVHLVSSPATSGVTATIGRIAFGLRDLWEPVLVHYGHQEGIAVEFLKEGISVHSIPSPPLKIGPFRTRWILFHLRKIVSDIAPCLVHAHSFDADLMAARSLPAGSPPIVVTVHSFSYLEWINHHRKDYIRWGNRFSAMVPVSQLLARELRTRSPLGRIPMSVVWNVPDSRFFEPIDPVERRRVRARFGFRTSDTVIACVANFHPVKGHDVLASAFRSLLDKHPGIRLLVAGGAGPDPDRQAFQARVKGMLQAEIASGRAVIVDPCEEVRSILAAADIYVQPSRSEALSVSIAEAMAMGLPIVATAVGGTPEIVISGKTGLLVPPDHPNDMAASIVKLIANPPQCETLGKAAKAFAEEHLHPSVLQASYRHVYEAAMNP